MLIADDLDKLLEILPDFVRQPLESHDSRKFLIEIVMDLGRRPEARFPAGPEYLSTKLISWYDLDYCMKKIGNFSGDNRSGIECTLHRISSIKNRKGNIIGLTCRVGRAIFGTISIIRDLLETNNSILLLGKPGVGKTTAIREIARVLADEMEKRVVIIDTSNEIAGDGDIPHPAIGRARRMQVARPELQHQVMIEAVENHMPQVIIIDEIGTELESLAARTIAERGVQLVGTAHGNSLENLIKNPILSDLLGGIQYVTLGDDEAKRRGSQKSVLERKASPAFQVAIEIHERNSWIIHEKVDQIVDLILQNSPVFLQHRRLNLDGSIFVDCKTSTSANFSSTNRFNDINLNWKNSKYLDVSKLSNFSNNFVNSSKKQMHSKLHIKNSFNDVVISEKKSQTFSKGPVIVYVYALNLDQIQAAITTFDLPIVITRDILQADIVLVLKSNIKHNVKLRQIAKLRRITIYTIPANTIANILRAFKQILNINANNSSDAKFEDLKDNNINIAIYVKNSALIEACIAVEKIVIHKKESVELLPRLSILSQLQYNLISLYNVKVHAFERNFRRGLRIYPC
uniref:AAA+ ATPase domain-containing protein n=1 Tax=Spyridia filamentosa TaxID=196632 RepID=A0A1Z1MJJ0_SPYFI|nr:hypothetical protein [Spyridia filamentosa]ARW66237.1 hypothetical protein [Spyridia filamentosa]